MRPGPETVAMHEFAPGPDNTRDFRTALARFATGVTVVTTMTGRGPLGITVNSFTSVSLDPPLVLWCAAKRSRRFDAFAAAEHFAIHVLGDDQGDLSHRFARGGHDFDGTGWELRDPGVPILSECIARFECAMHASHDSGDHRIILGRVLRSAWREGAPMLFHDSANGMLARKR